MDWKKAMKKPVIPKLGLWRKLLLYLATVVFAALSLADVIWEMFPAAVGILFYTLAAITFAASCCYLISDLTGGVSGRLRPEIEKHSFVKRVVTDYRYRTVLFAVPGLVLNIVFAVFNGVVGIRSRSAWYVTLSVFHGFLSLMRFSAIRYEKRDFGGRTEERAKAEIRVYRYCGILLIIMTIALAGAVILLINSKGGKSYPGYTIFVVAMYTFYKVIAAVINVIKAGKLKSPLLMAIRNIGYVNACVSLLFLQTAMFASFGEGSAELEILMNGLTGVAVCVMTLAVGVRCVVSAGKMTRLSGQGVSNL